MLKLNKLIVAVIVCVSTTVISQAKEWRGIKPLQSTRQDVEQLLGSSGNPWRSNPRATVYESPDVTAIIFYSDGDCGTGWRVPHDFVTSINVKPKGKIRLSDLGVDKRKYELDTGGCLPDIVGYRSYDEGVYYEVYKTTDVVIHTMYFPTKSEEYLACPDIENDADN